MKTLTVINNNLSFELSTDTIYINTATGQGAQTNLALTVTNTDANVAVFKSIAILLPVTITTSPDGITTKADATIWNFKKSSTVINQFDASPATVAVSLAPNASFTLELNTIRLVNTIAPSPVQVIIKTKLDGQQPAFNTILNVAVKPAVCSIESFSVNKPIIKKGEAAELKWQCNMITDCMIEPGGIRKKATDTLQIQINETTFYTLWAYAPGIVLFAQVSVTVAFPKITLTSNIRGKVPIGSNVNLEWTGNQYVKTVILSDSGGIIPRELVFTGAEARNKTITVGPINNLTTFKVSATQEEVLTPDTQFVKDTEQINNVVDVTASFRATPNTDLWQRDKVRLEWDINSATEISITPAVANGPSLQKLKGSVEVNPEHDTIYTLKVKGFIDNRLDVLTKTIDLKVKPVEIRNFEYRCFESKRPELSCYLKWDVVGPVKTINGENVNDVGEREITNRSIPYTLKVGTPQNPDILSKIARRSYL